MLLDV
jgi:hypothetical protein